MGIFQEMYNDSKNYIKLKWNNFLKTKFYNKLKEETRKLFIKAIIIGLIILGLYLLYLWLSPYFFEYLKQHPTLNAIYTHISTQISEQTYLGLFYASFFGAIFFITIPLELILIYYISIGRNIFLISLIIIIASVLGLFINYIIGRMLGAKVLKYLLKENFDKTKNWVDKYGAFFLVIGAAIPSPIEWACLIYGSAKYSIKKFLIYSAVGRILKVILIYFLFDWITKVVIPYFKAVF